MHNNINMFLTESTLELYAAKIYDNPNCLDKEEFLEDFSRFKYLKRLFKKYQKGGELKERLILNHLVVLFNVFENDGCLRILFFKHIDMLDVLKPFLVLLNRLPPEIELNKKIIYTSDIAMDQFVVNSLRENVLCHKL